MNNIWFISDTHLNHDKEFVWKVRGFDSVTGMNEAIITNWNQVIKDDDIVYHLGDFILRDVEAGIKIIQQLKGHIRLAYGNHDTDDRIKEFRKLSNIEDIQFGYRLKTNKKTLLLTHYPMLTGNFDNSKTYSIHGHTHSKQVFCDDNSLMYNVCCDAHNCKPIAYEDMLAELNTRKDFWTKNNNYS